jgi:hypothetical protein
MTQAAEKLLEDFDALPDREQAEVLAELLRRIALAPHDLPESGPADWWPLSDFI